MRLLIVFLLTIVAAGCGSSIPDDVLPPEKMQRVYWDVMQAEELSLLYGNTDTSYLKGKADSLYQTVFLSHQITREQFERSARYYEGRPVLLKELMDSLHAQGERKQQSAYADSTSSKQ